MQSYKTVKKVAFAEFTEKKSRFIGQISPVTTAEEAAEFIDKIKKKTGKRPTIAGRIF